MLNFLFNAIFYSQEKRESSKHHHKVLQKIDLWTWKVLLKWSRTLLFSYLQILQKVIVQLHPKSKSLIFMQWSNFETFHCSCPINFLLIIGILYAKGIIKDMLNWEKGGSYPAPTTLLKIRMVYAVKFGIICWLMETSVYSFAAFFWEIWAFCHDLGTMVRQTELPSILKESES